MQTINKERIVKGNWLQSDVIDKQCYFRYGGLIFTVLGVGGIFASIIIMMLWMFYLRTFSFTLLWIFIPSWAFYFMGDFFSYKEKKYLKDPIYEGFIGRKHLLLAIAFAFVPSLVIVGLPMMAIG